MSDIIEIANRYPTHFQKRFISSADRSIIPELRRETYDTCRGDVPVQYIHQSLNRFKKGIVYIHDGVIQAFCLWKPLQLMSVSGIYKTIEVLLICSKRQEIKMLTRILFDIEAYCTEHGINNIVLQPMNERLKNYYKDHGFVGATYLPGFFSKQVLSPIVIHPYKSDDEKRHTRRKHSLMKTTNRRRTVSVANRAEAYSLSPGNIDDESDSDEE